MAKKTTDIEARTVAFDFDDGEASIVIEYDKLSDAMKIHAGLHGISQKGGDSYASAKKTCAETGADPVEWSRAQCEQVQTQLYNDDWTVRVAGAGTTTDLAVAFEEVTSETLSPDLDADQKKALRAHPQIKAVLDRIKLERQARKAAVSEALAETADAPDLTEFAS